ncbi:MAG TPA: condensation domain-containing protein, partial [Longimicrobium sp.]|nr:condensation domain-containing protein [Longimicrobium sp.]
MTDTLTAPALTAEEKRARLAELLRRKEGPLRQFPLTFAQQRIWFLDQMEPGNPAFNTTSAMRMRGDMDLAAMEKAVANLVRRHEPLRTVFRLVGGEPVQVVLPFRGFPVPLEALDAPEEERLAVARRRVAEEMDTRFDLARAPVFHARILRLAPDDHVLLMCMHHIVIDGWSMGVLYRELNLAYAAYAEGREPELPELPIQYADYAVWQRGHLQGQAL